jgi:L-arabinose isomerase
MAVRELRVGLCGIGLDAYWPQFAGLREQLEGNLVQVQARLQGMGIHVEALGLVDTPQRGSEAGHACRRADVDLLLLYATTYALSSTVLPLVQRARVPVIVLNLQPGAAIDYEAFNRLPNRAAMTGAWLAWCSACPVPEIANVMRRARIPFHQVTGTLTDEGTWGEIEEWVQAAKVKSALAENRLGLMGHYYGGMLDVATDTTQVSITFGSHIEVRVHRRADRAASAIIRGALCDPARLLCRGADARRTHLSGAGPSCGGTRSAVARVLL